MDNLYLLLIVSGSLVLLVVAVAGYWQAHKAGRMQRVKTDTPKKNDLATTFGIEPVLEKQFGQHADTTHATVATAASGYAHADFKAEPPVTDKAPNLTPAIGQYTCMIDPLVDAIVNIELDHPILGGTALAASAHARRAGSKPMYFEGWSTKSGQWEALQSAQMYQRIQVGLQLASRQGALNEIEFSEYIMKMNSYAETLNGSFVAPDMIEIVNRARSLDEFACEHDVQLSLYLIANKVAWSPSYIQQQAASLGFVAGAIPGRLVIPSMQAGAPPILVLQYDMQAAMADDPNMMPVNNIALSLDVPQTDRLEQPFKLMYKVAATLSKSMQAVVTDDQGMELSAQAFDDIHTMLEKIYDELEQRELPAGSMAARRLFS